MQMDGELAGATPEFGIYRTASWKRLEYDVTSIYKTNEKPRRARSAAGLFM
jgi:hypothetical protein